MINLELINHGDKETQTINLISIVNKHTETLQYSKYLDDRSVGISYVDSKEINSKDHLEINDLSWRLQSNNENFFEELKEFTNITGRFSSIYRDLLVTRIFDTDKEGNRLPLYLKHKRKVKEATLHYIKNGNTFDEELGYKVVNDFIYTNYENLFNDKNGHYKVFFVSGIDDEGNSFNELLDVEPAIKEASWEDIDLETGLFTRSVLKKELISNRWHYTVVNPEVVCGNENSSFQYYVKAERNNLIKIKRPYQYSLENPWLLEITDGFVYENNNRYFVPEFINQPFEIEKGLLRLVQKRCNFVTPNIIKLPAEPVKILPEEQIHLEVFVYDESENLIQLLTTNEEEVGQRYNNSDVKFEAGIESFDNYNGFVELSKSIDASYIIKATFLYKTKNYLFNELDVNLYNNKDLIFNRIHFYLIPNQVEKSIYYHIVDEENRIIKTSNPEFKLIKNNVYNPNTYIGKQLSQFKNDYCVGYINEHQYLELGEVSNKENYYVDEVFTLDVREKSYLKDEVAYFDRQFKGLQSKFGYGELGQKVQKNNLVYIKYPIELLEQYGGEYTEELLDRYSRRKLPVAVDLVIDYEYMKPELDFTVNENDITISISWEGVGNYILERSIHKSGEKTILTEINSTSEESLSYVDSSVENNKIYYYTVRVGNHPSHWIYGVKKV